MESELSFAKAPVGPSSQIAARVRRCEEPAPLWRSPDRRTRKHLKLRGGAGGNPINGCFNMHGVPALKVHTHTHTHTQALVLPRGLRATQPRCVAPEHVALCVSSLLQPWRQREAPKIKKYLTPSNLLKRVITAAARCGCAASPPPPRINTWIAIFSKKVEEEE